jgi:hypothetical protein
MARGFIEKGGEIEPFDDEEEQTEIVNHMLTDEEYRMVSTGLVLGDAETQDAIRRDYNYDSLESVLNDAYSQAAFGKGKERHATDEPFEKQISATIEAWGLSYCEGQAVKKIVEAHRTGSEEDLLGAINNIAIRILNNRKVTASAREEC